jgi:hypothetical protein
MDSRLRGNDIPKYGAKALRFLYARIPACVGVTFPSLVQTLSDFRTHGFLSAWE